jgi:anti-sigma factor RsiW
MKTCDKYRELLPEFLEGALGSDAAADVATHLADCAPCRAELGFVRNLTAAARRLPPPKVSDGVVLRMMEKVRDPSGQPRRTDFGPVLDVNDLAEYLRMDMAALEPYLADIPCFELGGKLLFRRQTVEAWVQQKEQSLGFSSGFEGGDRIAVPESAETGGSRWTL